MLFRRFRDDTDARVGLICFSADWASPVLWSNYGDKHRGICLGFDVPRTSVHQVEYESERLAAALDVNESPEALPPALQELLLRTKFEHWSYEEEWRHFVDLAKATKEGPLYFCPFGSHMALREVILGPRCVHPLESVAKIVRSLTDGATTSVRGSHTSGSALCLERTRFRSYLSPAGS